MNKTGKYLLTIAFLLLHFTVYADKADDFSDIINDIAKVISASNDSKRPVRLAVMTFISTNVSSKNEFGIYFTESLTTALAGQSRKIKIFERKRLDVIMQENALNLSGLIDEKQALKLGELAPLDFIFSGTYTKLANTIDVNGRLIDVVTGEILTSYSGSIKVTSELNTLFGPGSSDKPQIDPCRQKQQEIEYLLNDLSTAEKIENAAVKAAAIPFDNNCGKIHYTVMSDFKRYKIDNRTYKLFLMQTLNKIEVPDKDGRAEYILRYLAKDDYIDKEEWQIGLQAVRRVNGYRLSSFLSPLLLRKDKPKDLETIYRRIDEFVSLVKQKKAGLPIPVEFNTAFFELMDAFNYVYAKDNIMLMYCYEKYGSDILMDEKIKTRVFNLLKIMYLRESEEKNKKKILNWIIDFLNENEMSEKLAEDLYSFASKFEITSYKKDNPEKIREAPPEHLKIFINGAKSSFCEALALAGYRSQIEDRTDFCLENGIPCPGHIPTIEECINDIKSGGRFKKSRAFEILEKMGSSAGPAEDIVRDALSSDDLTNETETSIIQKHAANILGNIRTNNPESLRLLVKALGSLNYKVPDAAQAALVKIGRPAVPFLIEALDSRFGGVQYKAVVALGKIGKDAAQAAGPLEKKYKTTNNSAVYRAIEITLKAIK